jgi:hypothetical protein
MVMYHPAPRVETIVYIKKENRSIVYSSPHDSVSQERLEKYLRDEREQANHSDSKRELGKESVSCTDFVLIMTFKVYVRDLETIFIAKQSDSLAPRLLISSPSWLPLFFSLANFPCDSIPNLSTISSFCCRLFN